MNETHLASPTQATPLVTNLVTNLATQLASSSTPHELGSYRGVLTPIDLDEPARETAALTAGAAVHDLGWMKRVAVRGEDRFRWLSGMVTNMVNDLAPNAGAWNLVLNAQGRIQGDLYVWREGGGPLLQRQAPAGEDHGLELQIAADQFERLMAHLQRFIIMDDVELAELSGESALGLTGPACDEVLERLSLPTLSAPLTATRLEWNGLELRLMRGYGVLAPHYELWAPDAQIGKLWKYLRTAGATPVGSASLDAFRIVEGIPAYGVDMAERDLPQETSQMRALHFNKGCYLGQEIVERIRSRGSVHRHLRQLELVGPAPAAGTELAWENGMAAGQITSAAELPLATGSRVFALGTIREEAELRNQPLTYAVGAAKGIARILTAPPSLNE